MTRKIIAFTGKAGSGKDYRCQELVDNFGYKKLAFADTLKKFAFYILGFSYEYGMEHYEELKRTKIINGLTLRNILERLGTDCIRKYDKDFWIKCLIQDIKSISPETNICISDIRFFEEYKSIFDFCTENGYEFKCIFCDYHSYKYENNNTHSSAQLANFLQKQGYKNGDEIKYEDMIKFSNQN
ncbi:MAG: hypothetical protein ACLRFI_00180 [Alphaproteobacteria bacterium]